MLPSFIPLESFIFYFLPDLFMIKYIYFQCVSLIILNIMIRIFFILYVLHIKDDTGVLEIKFVYNFLG